VAAGHHGLAVGLSVLTRTARGRWDRAFGSATPTDPQRAGLLRAALVVSALTIAAEDQYPEESSDGRMSHPAPMRAGGHASRGDPGLVSEKESYSMSRTSEFLIAAALATPLMLASSAHADLDPTPRMSNSVRIAGSVRGLYELYDGSYFDFYQYGTRARLSSAVPTAVQWECDASAQPTRKAVWPDRYAHFVGYVHSGHQGIAPSGKPACGETQFQHSSRTSNMWRNPGDNSEVVCDETRCRGTISAVDNQPGVNGIANTATFTLDVNEGAYLYQYFNLARDQNGAARSCSSYLEDLQGAAGSTPATRDVAKRWVQAMSNTGAWELAWDPANGKCTELYTGKSWTGSWTASGGQSATHSGNPRFEFQIPATTNVHLNLMSSTDTYLYLVKDGVTVASNDDRKPGERNSRIEQTLTAGRYTVVAATYAASAGGRFVLTATGASDLEHALRFEESGTLASVNAVDVYPLNNDRSLPAHFRAVFAPSTALSAKLRLLGGATVATASLVNGRLVLDAMLNAKTRYQVDVRTTAAGSAYSFTAMADGGSSAGFVEFGPRVASPAQAFSSYLEHSFDSDSYTFASVGGNVAITQGASVPATVEVRKGSTLISTFHFGPNYYTSSNYRLIGFLSAGTYQVTVRKPLFYAHDTGRYNFGWSVR